MKLIFEDVALGYEDAGAGEPRCSSSTAGACTDRSSNP